eukprot:1187171-Amphidinium_carterae.1
MPETELIAAPMARTSTTCKTQTSALHTTTKDSCRRMVHLDALQELELRKPPPGTDPRTPNFQIVSKSVKRVFK